MPEETTVEQLGLTEAVLDDFVNGTSIRKIAAKYDGVSWQNVAYFLEKHEDNNTAEWLKAVEHKQIRVADEFSKVKNRLDTILDDYDKLKNDSPDDSRVMILANRETRETLRLIMDLSSKYADLVDKWRKWHQEDLSKALLEVLKEIDQEVAAKVWDRIKRVKEERELLKQ